MSLNKFRRRRRPRRSTCAAVITFEGVSFRYEHESR